MSLKFTKQNKVSFSRIDVQPPLIYKSTASTFEVPTSKIEYDIHFRRAGIIPYTYYNGETIFFFDVFSGSDRTKIIKGELADFGGKVEDDENFIQAACRETLEESLGIFNFLGKDNEIASISQAVFTYDRAYIILLVPIIIYTTPYEIVELYNQRRKEVENVDFKQIKRFLNNIKNFELPELDIDNVEIDYKWNPKPEKQKWYKQFNYMESKYILPVSIQNLDKLLNNEKTMTPEELHEIMNYYPSLYFAISDRLNNSTTIKNMINDLNNE